MGPAVPDDEMLLDGGVRRFSEKPKPYVFVDPGFETDRISSATMTKKASSLNTAALAGSELVSKIEPFVGGDLEQGGHFVAALKARCKGKRSVPGVCKSFPTKTYPYTIYVSVIVVLFATIWLPYIAIDCP
jgi:hypothetical protein